MNKFISQDEFIAYENAVSMAESKFKEAVSNMIIYVPQMICFYSLCEHLPLKEEKLTMRVNTRNSGSIIYLEYNPWFIVSLDSTVLSALLYVEAMRIALHHCTSRIDAPLDIFKMASDVICYDGCVTCIDANVKENVDAIAALPSKLTYQAKIFNKYKWDNNEDWFLEKVFKAFCENMETTKNCMSGQLSKLGQPNQQNQQGNGQGQNNGQGQSQSQGQGQGQGQQNQQNGGGQQNQQGGGGGQQNQQGGGGGQQNQQNGGNNGNNGNDSSNSRKIKSQAESLRDHLDPNNAQNNTSGWGENSLIDRQIMSTAKKALSNRSSWGNTSGGFEQALILSNTPKFDPRTIIKNFYKSVLSRFQEDTRMRPNRRYGWEYPGHIPIEMCRILIAIDCSGSMSDEDIKKAIECVVNICRKAEVWYCFWDGICGDFKQAFERQNKFDLIGRGCTNPQSVIDKFYEVNRHKKFNLDGIVMITDCQFSWEKPKFRKPIFIIQSRNPDPVPTWCRHHMSFDDIDKITY